MKVNRWPMRATLFVACTVAGAATAQTYPTQPVRVVVAYGAGGEKSERLHQSATYGSLRMDAYAFG